MSNWGVGKAVFVLAVLAGPAAADGVTKRGEPDSLPVFGVMADVGAPDGANVSLVVRPISRVRIYGGVGHNYVSRGVRGGIAISPLRTWITPTLSADYGRYFEGDANPLARMISGDPTFSSPALDHVGYDYATARVGLELGRRRFTFFLHAGATRITSTVHNLSTSANATMVTFSNDPTLKLTTLSARLGFILYLK